jgi:hypothetical protein
MPNGLLFCKINIESTSSVILILLVAEVGGAAYLRRGGRRAVNWNNQGMPLPDADHYIAYKIFTALLYFWLQWLPSAAQESFFIWSYWQRY